MGNCMICFKTTSSQQQWKQCIKELKELKELKDECNIDDFFNVIKDLIKRANNPFESQQTQLEKPNTSATSITSKLLTLIKCGGRFLTFINEHIVKEDIEKTTNKDTVFGVEGTKIFSDTLQELGKIHWVFAVLSIVGYLLHKFEKMSENKAECLELLKCVVDLIDHIKKINTQMPEEENRLRDARLLIFDCCIMCASQMQDGKFFRFMKTSVNSEMLKGLTSKINNLYRDLNFTVVVDIHHKVSEIQEQLLVTNSSAHLMHDVTLPLEPPEYPRGAVMSEELVNEITERFEGNVMVIHGQDNIILGKAVASKVYASMQQKLDGFSYTKIIFEDQQINFTRMQLQLLKDVFLVYQQENKIDHLRHSEEGRGCLTRAFKSEQHKPVFIFIENVPQVGDLRPLLPEDLSLSQNSRILVTTKDSRVKDFFTDSGLSCKTHPGQPKEEINQELSCKTHPGQPKEEINQERTLLKREEIKQEHLRERFILCSDSLGSASICVA